MKHVKPHKRIARLDEMHGDAAEGQLDGRTQPDRPTAEHHRAEPAACRDALGVLWLEASLGERGEELGLGSGVGLGVGVGVGFGLGIGVGVGLALGLGLGLRLGLGLGLG